MKQTTDISACREHANLMNSSMRRRIERGESVASSVSLRPLTGLIEEGAGALFQAFQDDVILSSNLILLAPTGAYNHSSGTSPLGMKFGAAHFIIHEIGLALREEGKAAFNLGGTDQEEGGLERFKSGFGSGVKKTTLDAALFAPSSVLRSASRNFAESLVSRLR